MTGEPTEGSLALAIGQGDLIAEAVSIFGVAPAELAGWDIWRIRNDGLIEATVPLDQIQTEGVPTDPRNVEELVKDLDKTAKQRGGTGQRDPAVVCHVPGEGFFLVDGFHRHQAQLQRGEESLLVTVEPNQVFDTVVARRLYYAKNHTEIEFARQVEWMQENWDRTEWKSILPNVLTAFRAADVEYFADEPTERALIDGLSDEQFEGVSEWVRTKSKEWGYTPKQIREKLAKAEGFDPELMQLVYQKQGKPPEGRIGLGHVEVISEVYPGEYDLQAIIVDFVTGHGFSVPFTRLVLEQVERHNTSSPKKLKQAIAKINIRELRTSSQSRSNGGGGGGGTSFDSGAKHLTIPELLDTAVAKIKERRVSRGFSEYELRVLGDVAFQLTDVLAEMLQEGEVGKKGLSIISDSVGQIATRVTQQGEPKVSRAPKTKAGSKDNAPIFDALTEDDMPEGVEFDPELIDDCEKFLRNEDVPTPKITSERNMHLAQVVLDSRADHSDLLRVRRLEEAIERYNSILMSRRSRLARN